MARLICIVLHVIRGTLTGQHYVDEVCPVNLSDCWKQFSLPVRKYPHFLQYGKELLVMAYYMIHLQSTTPLGYLRLAGTLFLSLHSYQITQIGTTAGRTMGLGWGTNVYPGFFLSTSNKFIECINKGGGNARYDLQYINL